MMFKDALSDQESYDQQEMLRTGGGTTSKRKRPDDGTNLTYSMSRK